MSKRRFGLIGAGAVGAYYAGKLSQLPEVELHVLLRSDYQAAREHGIRIQSATGDFVLAADGLYNRAADMPRCDVVLVGLKTTHNHLLPDLLAPLVGPQTTVVLLQNGLGEEERLAEQVRAGAWVSGICRICAEKIGPAQIAHLDLGALILAGAAVATDSASRLSAAEAADQVAATCRQADISTTVVADHRRARWKKLVWNIPFNGLATVLRTDTRRMSEDPASGAILRELMAEVIAAANACGCDFPERLIEDNMRHTQRMQPFDPSMKQDFDHQRTLELPAMYVYPLQMAAAAGVSMPLVQALHRQLQFLERQYGTVASGASG
mgnify:CR=1 FL=1